MDNKLTLKLDNEIIEKAKLYARKKNTSLSKLVESYLEFLTSSNSPEAGEVTPLVRSLSGILDLKPISDHKKSYKDHIKQKYSK